MSDQRISPSGAKKTFILSGSASLRELKLMLSLMVKDPLAVLGLIIILLFIFTAIFAPLIAPYPEEGYGKPNMGQTLLPPSLGHPFGTDYLGRDILSRVILGTTIALQVAVSVVVVSATLGTLLGIVAGYSGGYADTIIMRITDVFLSFPSLLLAILIMTVLGPGIPNASLAIALSWWPWYTRLGRSKGVLLRELQYVDAARAVGLKDSTIILKHILPNALPPIIIQASMDMGAAILAESGLSFIGLGAQAPSPDWGLMINTGRVYILGQWWISLFPGLAVFLVLLAFNFMGDSLREITDPKLRKGYFGRF
jgi:peptide/nickel transport system permease protein